MLLFTRFIGTPDNMLQQHRRSLPELAPLEQPIGNTLAPSFHMFSLTSWMYTTTASFLLSPVGSPSRAYKYCGHPLIDWSKTSWRGNVPKRLPTWDKFMLIRPPIQWLFFLLGSRLSNIAAEMFRKRLLSLKNTPKQKYVNAISSRSQVIMREREPCGKSHSFFQVIRKFWC